MKDRTYLCIDLKSFYASVECIERGLDAMTTNLIVADASRTDKTICLAVSPSLKSFGIPGRPRLFEVAQRINVVNGERAKKAPGHRLSGESFDYLALQKHPSLGVSYIVAPPRMAYYMLYSTKIYEIYLQYIAPEDIHVYSIDEVFMDITHYLQTYKKTPRELAMMIIRDVLAQTGITATAGIGTNMYLAKVAMDIVAKHTEADGDGVRIAELDEMSYRRTLWHHRPLVDFWRVGKGYAKRLEAAGLFTMGDIARESLTEQGENRLYKLFGVNAEFLIDHAWGWEPCTIADIRAYEPETKSLGSGQVLHQPYDFEKARLIVQEMTELLVLDLVDRRLVTKQIVLTVGYDRENLEGKRSYKGEITEDAYGRKIPKHAHGTTNLLTFTSSTRLIVNGVMELYDRIVDRNLLIRRINLVAAQVVEEDSVQQKESVYDQLDLFTDYAQQVKEQARESVQLEKERKIQETILKIKKQYGKNAILKGINLEEGATTIDRNNQIGGHKA
ncbi:MAG: DNA methylase [Ruminococcaceae bacterium]|nr:DNA methylase [Oscillospiraceae bacterium]